MNESSQTSAENPSFEAKVPQQIPDRSPHASRNRWIKIIGGVVIISILIFTIAAEYILHNAEPILRKRIIETLSQRFNAPVQLDTLHISLIRGIEVSGSGLRVPYGGPSNPDAPGTPHIVLSVGQFNFHSNFKAILHSPTHIVEVNVNDLVIDLPAGYDRNHELLGPNQQAASADPTHPKTQPKLALLVDRIHCTNTRLIIETDKPDREPKIFAIQNLVLRKVGLSGAFSYEAHLVNPIPRGEIQANGDIGPWNTENPRETPLNGKYTFTDADMNTIKGIGGTLSSVGQFDGVLERLIADGTADVPNFSLDVSNHPVPLHTQFHALVDGTTGDTTLQPVQATLGKSNFTCTGTVAHIKGKGHDIALDVDMPHGRIQDLLQLGMKTEPPVMRGAVTMKAKLHIPPGDVRVAQKMQIVGALKIQGVEFSNTKLQDRIDGLSMRAQGKPEDVKTASSDHTAEVSSQMNANFSLANAIMLIDTLNYEIPGAHVQLAGVYSLDGKTFEFKGHVRTDATASQMLTGWKSKMVKPFDDFFKKNGAGVQLPIALSGTGGDVKFGLAMHDANESAKDMAVDVKSKHQANASAPR